MFDGFTAKVSRAPGRNCGGSDTRLRGRSFGQREALFAEPGSGCSLSWRFGEVSEVCGVLRGGRVVHLSVGRTSEPPGVGGDLNRRQLKSGLQLLRSVATSSSAHAACHAVVIGTAPLATAQ